MSEINIDHATLRSAASDVRAVRDDVSGDLRQLSGAVDTLVSSWQGQAATSFQQLMTRWNEDAGKLLQAMADIADLLDKSGTQHEANEEAQARMFNTASGGLN